MTVLKKLERNNAHVSDYLNAYRLMESVDFAVMITGSWGSGKTEFVKRWANSLKKIDNDDKPDYLFVSLNGVATLEEIDSLLFRAAHPILGSKSARIAGKVLSTLAAGLKFSVAGEGSKSTLELSAEGLKDLSFDKWIGDAPIVIFDDIERCCVDIESLMGYFDDLLKNGKKLVLVCAENEIKKRWTEDARNQSGRLLPSYDEISTKVIGKRFFVEAEMEDLYGVLVAQVGCNTALSEFLISQKGGFVAIFRAVEEFASQNSKDEKRVHNYRAFKHALRDLAYWYGKMPVTERKDAGFLCDFSRPFVMIDYAMLTNVLDREELLNGGLWSGESKSSIQQIMSRVGIRWNTLGNPDVGVSLDVMQRMLFSEKISKDELAQSVRASRHFLRSEDSPEWQQLMQWNYLEDQQVDLLIDKVERKIANRRYVAAEEILHVFSLLGEMATYKILAKTPEQIVNDCETYVDQLVTDDKFKLPDYDPNRCQWLDDHGMGIQYAGSFDDKPYYKAIEQIVMGAIRTVDSKTQSAKVNELLPELSVFPGKFYSEIRGSSSRWHNEAVFNLIDVQVFYEAYCSLSNENKNNVGRLIYSRVGRSGLEKEKDFWVKLIKKLNEEVGSFSGATIPPSVFQKKVLADQLDKKLHNRQ